MTYYEFMPSKQKNYFARCLTEIYDETFNYTEAILKLFCINFNIIADFHIIIISQMRIYSLPVCRAISDYSCCPEINSGVPPRPMFCRAIIPWRNIAGTRSKARSDELPSCYLCITSLWNAPVVSKGGMKWLRKENAAYQCTLRWPSVLETRNFVWSQ